MTAAQFQAALALVLALGLHLAAFTLRPDPVGASGSGAGGTDLITLQSANPTLSDMVALWDAPPPPPVMAAQPEPVAPDLRPDIPVVAPALAPSLETVTAAPLAAPEVETPPTIDSAPAPPTVKPKPKPKPQPQAKPDPAPRPAPTGSPAAQTAAGAGGGAAAGMDGQAQAPTLSQGQTADLTSNWGASIRARIERRKRYPLAADGAAGTVTIRLTITRSGALTSLSVATSSGNAALDEAAIKAVRNAGKFPAAPRGLTLDSYSFTLPMRFSR